jgi:hypothetical protein
MDGLIRMGLLYMLRDVEIYDRRGHPFCRRGGLPVWSRAVHRDKLLIIHFKENSIVMLTTGVQQPYF